MTVPHPSIAAMPAARAHSRRRARAGASGSGRGYLVRDRLDLGALAAVTARILPNSPAVVLRLDVLPKTLTLLQRLTLAAADLVLTGSAAVARQLSDTGVDPHRIAWVPAPADLAAFVPPTPRTANAERRLVYVGDLEPEAGAMDLFKAVQDWATANAGIHVTIEWIGVGCMQGVLSAQPPLPNVRQYFAPAPALDRPAMAAILSRSDLLLTPAVPGCWDHVLVEAMAAGLPVLGSARAGVLRALVSDGETGWLYDPPTPGAVARTVALALSTPPDARRWMGDHAAARARAMADQPRRDVQDACLARWWDAATA